MARLTILFLSMLLLVGCSTFTPSVDGLKPKANSEIGELILVMDSVHWSGDLGDALNKTFRSTVAGLPRPEPMFTVRQIQPQGFQSILKFARNIIIVYAMDNSSSAATQVRNYFTDDALAMMESDTARFMAVRKNIWAENQSVMFLYGSNEQELAEHIVANRNAIQQHFNSIETKVVNQKVFQVNEMVSVSDHIEENHGFRIRVPNGWRIEYESENDPFIWLRSPGIDVDKNVWVSYIDYTSEDLFEHPIQLRDQVTKKHIYDDKATNDTSYVVVETIVPPIVEEVNFGGQYAKKIRGLWKTNNLSMGGPFVSYVVADPYAGRLYYLDGFIYSPGKSQRELVRELEVILRSFTVSQPVANL